MKYLSPAEILFIHTAVIEETGGGHGIRDLGLLKSALASPQQTFAGRDLYKSVEEKAAILFLGLLRNHAFVDGNKRTAAVTLGVFLALNGRKLVATQDELSSWVLTVLQEQPTSKAVVAWIKRHSKSG